MKKLLIVSGALFFILFAIASAHAATKTPTPEYTIVEFSTEGVYTAHTKNPKTDIAIFDYLVSYKIKFEGAVAYIIGVIKSQYKPIVENQAANHPKFKVTAIYYLPTPTATRTP